MVNLTALLAFWKKKETSGASEPERVIPLPQMTAPVTEAPRSTSVEEVNRARETLKVFRLERQILGSALTTIYESQTKGVITQPERDRLLNKYKADLTRLEKGIEENQRLVDLFDLENARDELQKTFRSKMLEIDTQIRNLKSGGPIKPTNIQPLEAKSEQAEERKSGNAGDSERKERPAEKPKEKKPAEEKEDEISEAEKRVNQIREEILKAMDRLEQIEAEG